MGLGVSQGSGHPNYSAAIVIRRSVAKYFAIIRSLGEGAITQAGDIAEAVVAGKEPLIFMPIPSSGPLPSRSGPDSYIDDWDRPPRAETSSATLR